jgi:ATP-binding cassette subfamily B protein RaxB
MAERCGLRARAVRVGLEYLSQVTLPAIAHLAMDHYVVLYTLEEGKKVVLGDPARAIVALDWNAFAQQWSRHLLLIAPAGSAEGSLPKPMCAV